MTTRTETARITNTFLGREDHGIPTCMLNLEGDGWGQGFGGWDLRAHPTYVQTLVEIGHATEDRWFIVSDAGPRIVREDGSPING